jgi:hypothetical protein
MVLKPISSKEARAGVAKWHYSGRSTQNSQFHIGAFMGATLEGVMQFGPPMDRKKLLGLVSGTPWDGVLELNRMAFSDRLPANSESRAIGIAFRMLRKYAPRVKWVVSFADGTLCGDGTIYRASGFLLTGIKTNEGMARLPDGRTIHKVTLHSSPTTPRPELGGKSFYDVTGGKYNWPAYVEAAGGEILPGFQLRYIRFVDPAWRQHLTVEPLPYSAIKEAGAGMYKGEKR